MYSPFYNNPDIAVVFGSFYSYHALGYLRLLLIANSVPYIFFHLRRNVPYLRGDLCFLLYLLEFFEFLDEFGENFVTKSLHFIVIP